MCVIRARLNWIHNGVSIQSDSNSDIHISNSELHDITLVSNLTQTNIDPSVGGAYQCRYGDSVPEIVSNPITVTVLQNFVGEYSNMKSKREFLSFSIQEKITWFKKLTEAQHLELLIQFGLTQEELYDLKQRGC